MTMTKHSSAPWLFIQDQEKLLLFPKSSGYGSQVIAVIQPIKCSGENEQYANAKLMAAAPEMLAELENQLRLLEVIQLETGYVTLVTQLGLKKLIKKAKGE